ncbi:MAG: MarR family winged helix-turn-helix transcriptional regulator [Candidatus Limimorpha sp.]
MDKTLLVAAIGKLRNRLHRLIKQRYAVESEVKLTIEEFIILDMIQFESDQILQNIAIATGKNKSVVMRMIDSLENKGLAQRTVNPLDRRENLLSITPKGQLVVSQYRSIQRRFTSELLKDIPEEKLNIFYDVLGEIFERTK